MISCLARVHARCEQWARKHGTSFALEKYELIHLTRNPKKFNLAATLQLDATETKPKPSV
jgi:hypothetical protein